MAAEISDLHEILKTDTAINLYNFMSLSGQNALAPVQHAYEDQIHPGLAWNPFGQALVRPSGRHPLRAGGNRMHGHGTRGRNAWQEGGWKTLVNLSTLWSDLKL